MVDESKELETSCRTPRQMWHGAMASVTAWRLAKCLLLQLSVIVSLLELVTAASPYHHVTVKACCSADITACLRRRRHGRLPEAMLSFGMSSPSNS